MTIELEKSPLSDASHGCCGGKNAGDRQAAPTAVKPDDVKPKSKTAAASCCGGATRADVVHDHSMHG